MLMGKYLPYHISFPLAHNAGEPSADGIFIEILPLLKPDSWYPVIAAEYQDEGPACI